MLVGDERHAHAVIIVSWMADANEQTSFEVSCPHCGKTFEAELIPGAASRYEGFKCPHCRLFVPFERADDQERVKPSE
jgi:DNA-directed RNA polymerase subunit RPC12/RpoP